MPFYSIPFYSIRFDSIPFYSILFYSILLYSILLYSILFYSILLYSILFYSIWCPLHSPRAHTILIEPTPWLGSVRLRACGAGLCGAASAETSILFYILALTARAPPSSSARSPQPMSSAEQRYCFPRCAVSCAGPSGGTRHHRACEASTARVSLERASSELLPVSASRASSEILESF